MRRACVIGWPIEHSRSPLIHSYWLKRYGIDGVYTKEAVRPEKIEQFLRLLATNGYAGCNVTVPHKEAAFRVADIKDATAIAVGAANTIWLEGPRICAANTDTYGYMAYLDASAPDWQRQRRSVSVLGAGGAARTVVYGFLSHHIGEVRVFNRSRERADDLARHFGPRVKAHDWDERDQLSSDACVIVNTTTLGMNGTESPGMDFTKLDANTVVSDIVYVPLETGFIRAAKAAGLRTVDGLGMLLHQAVPGFEKWFGVRPEVTSELYERIAADIPRS
jgi:shikimate dehydrogenase